MVREAKLSSKVPILPPVILGGCFGMASLFVYMDACEGLKVHHTDTGSSVPVSVCGIFTSIGGLVLNSWGQATFSKHGTPVKPGSDAKCLVTSGPFAFTRNPLYVGASLVVSGLGLVVNSYWGAVCTIPFILYINFCVLPIEERYLESQFADYKAYCARTPRWLFCF
mmetsp:Transcript_15969/g.26096  ORF Transcript_15969/g.26096 Transcript_15969/m.26096 type:complete len:167 (-) Transcript_15969:66-566(-)